MAPTRQSTIDSIGTFNQERIYEIAYKKVPKTVKRSLIKKFWKDYVNIALVNPIMDGKEVRAGLHARMLIEGHRIPTTHPMYNLLKKGLVVTSTGFIKPADNVNLEKLGIIYKVKFQYPFNQKVKFIPDPTIRKRLNQELKTKHYKVVTNVNK